MSADHNLTVSFIIHQDFSHIQMALDSLYKTTRTPLEIYLIINTPNEIAVQQLRTRYPQAHFILNPAPLGFAANHNQVLRLAQSEFVALLNDDIILHEGAVDTLVSHLQAHPEVGLVGAQLKNPDGTNQVSVYSDPSLARMVYKISGLARLTRQGSALRGWLVSAGIGRIVRAESIKPDMQTGAVSVVKGAVMVVRRAAYLEVGLMDEVTLGYGEEMDWHWRLRQAGWQVAFVREAQVTHYGSGQAELNLVGHMLIEDRKAILNYWLKHRIRKQVRVLRLAMVVSHAFWGIVWLPFQPERTRIHFQVVKIALFWDRENGQG